MSTKAIRITLEWVKEQLEDSLDRPFSRDQTKLDEGRLKRLKEALAEVEAIERAAKDLMNGRQFRGSAETISTLAAISRDVP